MPKLETPKNSTPPSPPPQNTPAVVMVENKSVTKELKDHTAQGEKDPRKDDAPITTHPTKDYILAENQARVGGNRQFQSDLLCRHLNCTVYVLDQGFDWAPNPCGGAPLTIYYTRLFPEAKILYDNFDRGPDDLLAKMIAEKKSLAHSHGYRYIYQHIGKVLTPKELDAQLEEEKPFSKK